MLLRRTLFFSLSLLLIAGCSSTVETVKEDKDVSLKENQGYMLLGVDLNQSVKSIEIDGPKDIVLTRDNLKSKANYFLVPMPKGTYTIDTVRLNDLWRFELTDGLWDFEVQPGVISYVGDLNLRRSSSWSTDLDIELQNRSSQALVFLEDRYPNILNSRQLEYSGPGQDPFFDFVFKSKGQGAE